MRTVHSAGTQVTRLASRDFTGTATGSKNSATLVGTYTVVTNTTGTYICSVSGLGNGGSFGDPSGLLNTSDPPYYLAAASGVYVAGLYVDTTGVSGVTLLLDVQPASGVGGVYVLLEGATGGGSSMPINLDPGAIVSPTIQTFGQAAGFSFPIRFTIGFCG